MLLITTSPLLQRSDKPITVPDSIQCFKGNTHTKIKTNKTKREVEMFYTERIINYS